MDHQYGNRASNTSEMAEEARLQSYSISVLKPKYQVKDGKIPLSMATSSSSTSWYWGEAGWTGAELYLTSTTLCYKIKGTGVSEQLVSATGSNRLE